jgi:cyclic-di-GMP phosphodiesterase, flagellum assembly factor TipF
VIEIVIAAAYAALSAGLAFGLARYLAMDATAAALIGAVLFLCLGQLRATLMRLRDVQAFETDLESLRASGAAMRRTLDEAGKTMAELGEAFARKTQNQEKRLIGELKLIESLLRDYASTAAQRSLAAQAQAGARSIAAPAPDAAMADLALLEMIRSALEENRVDLHLQPVVSLPQRKLRFYEALTRLRSADGAVIMPEQYIRVAAPAGLMSVVDNLLLFRCVQVVRRFTPKHRETAVFCNISGHTLNDAEFFPQFLDFLHRHKDLVGRIVFEFAQGAILEANPAAEANLRYLSEMGFRLSMDQVTRLDADFARLKNLGFRFFKVRANTLVSGMKPAGSPVAAEDLKDLLARNGMALIAERIENEKSAVQLLEFNIELGQGYLFGEPRPIRDVAEVVEPHATPAPAPTPAQKPAVPAIARLARRLTG